MHKKQTVVHNLNIETYSFKDVLGIFELNYDITEEQYLRTKKRVLMTHPDKSGLPAEYFLFYKKAFDIVNNYYQQQTKQNKPIKPEQTQYNSRYGQELNKASAKKITDTLQSMDEGQFHKTFNELFDKNMAAKIDATKNEWFTDETADSVYNTNEKVNAGNMGHVIDKMRNQQGMVKYGGVQTMHSNMSSGTSFHDNSGDGYASCDPFGKLKYDDLRKVHKDQTVFSVSERDFENVPKYKSTDEYSRSRSTQDLTPLQKTHAEQMLLEQERIYKEKMLKQQHDDYLKTLEYQKRNQAVLSQFLQLKN